MTTRRDFIRDASRATAAALLLPDRTLIDLVTGTTPGAAPVRVRGRVLSAGDRPLHRVAVTDGLQVVRTDAEGRFELVTDAAARWLSASTPAGHTVPVSATGTAAAHRAVAPDARGEMDALFRFEPLSVDDDRHAFLLLADPQTQTDEEMARMHAETVPDVRRTVSALGDRPTFGVACGDIMYDRLALYPEYERAVAAMGIPFFQVVGNHDLDFEGRSDDGSTVTFEDHFGPGHYSFDRGQVHYVVLDDVFWHGQGYIGYLTERQLAWLVNDLEGVEPGSTVVVFLHIPLYTTAHEREGQEEPGLGTAVANRAALYRILEPFRAHIMSGHMHETEHLFEGGVHECVNGAVCGAWWSGDICYDGTPNGYGVYEVDGDEVRWRYKATGQPADHQLRAYRGSDGGLIANVWNWDPEWRVVWYQGGDRRGAMDRRPGLDPRSVAEHTGETLPFHRPWVDPVVTGHLFHAGDVAGTEVMVEATDRFGRVFTARPGR